MELNLPILNFPRYDFRIKQANAGALSIFDRCRKSFVDLTPEEWVRQHLLHFLIEEKQFPESLLVVEKSMKLNSTAKRADVLVYDRQMNPVLIAECKEPRVELSQAVLDQALRYSLVFRVKYLILTNGLRHYACMLGGHGATILQDIPLYSDL